MTTRDLITKLPVRYKEYFESKLAVTLLNNYNLFPTVQQISKQISHFITQNHPAIHTLVTQEQSKISHELYGEKYFGRLQKNSPTTPEKIITDMLNLLNTPNPKLKQIMQLHSLFTYRIFKPLTGKHEKHLSDQARGRKKTCAQTDSHPQLGLTRDSVFCTLIDLDDEHHASGRDHYEPDLDSEYHKTLQTENLPFAAGLSGHTAYFVLLATELGKLNDAKLQEYMLASFAFLAGGGHHTFYEVMLAAGVPYEINNYLISIPEHMQHSATFKKLTQTFPEILTNQEKKDKTQLYKNLLSKIGLIKTLHQKFTEKLLGNSRIAGTILQYAF